MTAPTSAIQSEISIAPEWGLRILGPGSDMEASYRGVIRYIGHHLFPQSLTTSQSIVWTDNVPNLGRFIMIAPTGSLSVNELESVPSSRYITDRELDEARVKNEVEKLHDEIIGCFSGLLAGEIEDGMSNDIGDKIKNLINEHKDLAVHLFAAIVHSKQLPEDVLSHALRWIGRIKHEETFHDRLWLLRNCLWSSSPIIRDGAALGIASLGSTHAIPSLQQAIQRERLPSLRVDLQQVLNELESSIR